MNLKEIVLELDISDSLEILSVEWESSQRAMPDGDLHFLSTDFVTEACRSIYLPEHIIEAALAAIPIIDSSPALRTLSWHWHWCLYRCGGYSNKVLDQWPSFDSALGDLSGMFYLIGLISYVPEMHANYRSRSIPEKILRDGMYHVYQRGILCAGDSKKWDLDARNARGAANFIRGDYYSVGKLTYQLYKLKDPIRVYRNGNLSSIIALSDDGIVYRPDGHTWMEGEAIDGIWQSLFVDGEKEIVGNPILPTGQVVPNKLCLLKSQWHQVLGRGDTVVFFHIPGGTPLDIEECGNSFQMALEFFANHFPEDPFRAFFCWSWLLDTQLEEWLPSTSNLVRFQREFYLYPGEISKESILNAVLGNMYHPSTSLDLSQAPRDTKLQRAMLDHVSSGKSVIPRAGRCFMLPDDLGEWGTQAYRETKFPWYLLDEPT